MSRLTERRYWEGIHRETPSSEAGSPRRGWRKGLGALLGGKPRAYSESYYRHLYLDVILPRHLPRNPGATIVEIGSAPGRLLIELSRRFGYDPYGIEFSPDGVLLNRRVFAEKGIPPEHVIEGDILNSDLLRSHHERFDVVFSHSFLEHFDEPRDLVARHLELLKQGGHLVIYIPNLRGLNKLLYRFFSFGGLERHNLALMDRQVFAGCFDPSTVETLYCNYLGTFNFGMFNAPEGPAHQRLLRFCFILQRGLNVLFRLLLRDRGLESRFLSPGLLFIGRKL